jgi:hypothetical protein
MEEEVPNEGMDEDVVTLEPAPEAEIPSTSPAPTIKAVFAVGMNKHGRPRNNDGSYKENPYTFLSADDPSIQQCMYAISLSLKTNFFQADRIALQEPT